MVAVLGVVAVAGSSSLLLCLVSFLECVEDALSVFSSFSLVFSWSMEFFLLLEEESGGVMVVDDDDKTKVPSR